jgi:hypothetical protein
MKLGSVHLGLHCWHEALACYEHAVGLAPDDAGVGVADLPGTTLGPVALARVVPLLVAGPVLLGARRPGRRQGLLLGIVGIAAALAMLVDAIVSHAAAVAGVDRRTVDRHRKTEPEFATLCLAAEEDATEALEKEARRRALTISDVLLIFLLKARRPAIYRENQRIEVTGADGGPVQTQQLLAGLDDHEKATLRKIIDAALAEAQVTA